MTKLTVNGKLVEVEVDGSTPLLWVLREQLGLTGTKYSCGIGLCGACAVHVDGDAARGDLLPVRIVESGSNSLTGVLRADDAA